MSITNTFIETGPTHNMYVSTSYNFLNKNKHVFKNNITVILKYMFYFYSYFLYLHFHFIFNL